MVLHLLSFAADAYPNLQPLLGAVKGAQNLASLLK